jgi:hypothetical protein
MISPEAQENESRVGTEIDNGGTMNNEQIACQNPFREINGLMRYNRGVP